MSRKLHDTKNDFKSRNILAFCLFVVLGILSVACVTKAVLLNGSVVQNQFTDYNVVSVFRQDLIDYTSDSFIKNGLDSSNVSNVITQAKAEKIISSFAAGQFRAKAGYTSKSYSSDVDSLMSDIKSELEEQISASGFEKNDSVQKAQLEKIRSFIDDNSLKLPKTKLIETAMNMGKIAADIFLAVAIFLTLVFGSMLYFTGNTKYRSIRSLGAAFCASSIGDLIVSLIAVIILSVKSIDIFPAFLKSALDNYIYTAVGAIAVCGAVLLLISLALLAISWKLKREN